MPNNTIQTSFAGGELSQALYARVDLAKFEVGAALLRNVVVDYRGGAFNRGGTKFISDLSALTGPFRLIPFIVSQDASYVLVFSNLLVTVFREGVSVDTVVVPYTAADLSLLKYAQSADVMTLTHPDYPPANLNRTSATVFAYEVIVVGPEVLPPTVTDMRAPHSGPYNYGYLVTSVDLDGKEESVPSNIAVKHSEGQDELNNRVVGFEWTAPATPVSRYNVFKWGPIDAVTMVPATAWGFIGTAQTVTFTDNNIAPDYAKQPPIWGDPFSGGQIESIVVATGGAGYDGVTGDWPAIPYVPLAFVGDGTGAAGYAVIDHANGVIVGAFITNPGKNYTTITATANGEGGTGATFTITLSDIDPLYPTCVSYLQQRRVYAGSLAKPATFVMSQPGLFDNFNITPVSLATDAIVATISSLQVNAIRSMVPVSYGLLAFTSGGCYLIGSSDGPTGGISPATISVTQQASPGANDLIPLLVNYDVLFGQSKGNRLLRAGFAWERQSFTTSDFTQLAPHLFDNYTTVDWCYAEQPHKLIWLVRDDGKLLSCTYVPEQDVYAWTRHDTQGIFKAICAVPEDDVDAVYVITERFVPPVVPDPPPPPGPVTKTVELTRTGRPSLWCQASVVGAGLTVTDIVGELHVGDVLYSPEFDAPGFVTITAMNPGTTGGVGGYTMDPPQAFVLFADLITTLAGTMSGNTLTITAAGPGDVLEIGVCVFGTGVPDNTYITAFGTGTGGTGTYTVSTSATVSSVTPLETRYGWRVPDDWSETNTVEAVGAGGIGGNAWMPSSSFSRGGGGGGSGGYAINTITGLTPAAWVPYQIGASLEGSGNNPLNGNCSGFNILHGNIPGANAVWVRGGGHGNGTGFGVGGSGGGIDKGTGVIGSAGGDGFATSPQNIPVGGGGGAGAPWVLTGAAGVASLSSAGANGGAGNDGIPGVAPGGIGGTGSALARGGGGGGGGSSATRTGGVGGAKGAGGGGGGGNAPLIEGVGGSGADGFVLITYEGETDPVTACDGWNSFFLERIDPRIETCLSRGWFLDSAVRVPLNAGDGEFAITPTEDELIWELGYCPTEIGHTFTPGDVVLIGCARITILSQIDSTSYFISIEGSLEDYRVPDDPDETFRLFTADMWEWVTPTATVTGLDHLEDKEVCAFADGEVEGPFTVADGEITLSAPAALILAGLRFTSQWKTLYITAEGIQPGTEQGKRKLTQGVTLRVDKTKGVRVGVDFDNLDTLEDTETGMYTGDAYTPINPDWNTRGEICVEQTQPLPASILGIILGVVPGDTGK